MKQINTVLLILISIYTQAQTYSGPESVEFDYANSRWLISNTQSHQVLARDSAGILSVFTTLTGSGPYGIEIVGDTLFCCNGASIKGFLLSNASQVFNVNVGATFLNGIAHDDSGNLVATDFSAKAIYKINIASLAVTPLATAMASTPNGIIFDAANNRCVFVNWSTNAPVKAIDMTTNVISTLITTSLGNCDGIARDGNGNYYITCWSGQKVVMFDSSFSSSPIDVVTGLNNPADIFYNTQSDTLGIPNAGDNTVTYFGFALTGIFENDIKFDLYPVPCTNHLHISSIFRIQSFEILDLNGRTVCSEFIDSFSHSIITADFPSGLYFIKVRTSNGLISRSFLKKQE